MNLVLCPETHTYFADGRRVPGVNEILSNVATRKDELSPWASISASEFCADEAAALFGDAFHEAAKYTILRKKFSCDKRLAPWLNGFKKFLSDHRELLNCPPEAIDAEKSLYSKKYNYAGTFDALYHLSSKAVLADWKTSTVRQQHWRLCTAAYEQLIRENYGITRRIPRWCVRIYENGYEMDRRLGHPQDWLSFLSCLNVYNLN